MCINAHVGDMKLMLSMDKYNESEKKKESETNSERYLKIVTQAHLVKMLCV